MAIRIGLFTEVVLMAVDTVWTNKLRSALTVLGVVIGITSIVGMTAMIRGFDQSLRELIAQAGPDLIYLERYGAGSFVNGFELKEFLRRPNLTVSDARALEEQTTTLEYVDIEFGAAPVGPVTQRRVFYRDLRSKALIVFGTGEFFAEGTRLKMRSGRYFNGVELQHRRNVAVLGYGPYQLLFENAGTDPIGKLVRIGAERFEVVGVFDKRPAPGGIQGNQDDFVAVPFTSYQRVFGMRLGRIGKAG